MTGDTLISIKSLNVRYPDGTLGLKEVSLEIKKGECVLLAGPTGSGKSTLAHALLNIIPARIRAEKTGSVSFEGKPIQDSPIERLSARIQLTLQNPDTMLFGTTVEENIRFGPENLGLPRETILEKSERALELFDLGALRSRSPLELSSGEKQRASLASAFAMDADCLILDEPFTYLDSEGRKCLAEYLNKLKAMGKTLIIIEHHFIEIVSLVDRVFVMEEGRVREEDRDSYYSPLKVRGLPAGMDRREGVMKNHNPSSSPYIKGSVSRDGNVMRLSIQNLSFSYPDQKPNFENLSFSLESLPPVLPLMGPNGCGKTTLGFILAGFLKPASGTAQFMFADKAPRVGYVFQRPEMQLFCRSVEEELAFGLKNMGLPRETIRGEVENMLGVLNLKEKRLAHPQNLSRGEKRRLAFGTAIIMKPDVLILDEPTVGQDAGSLSRLREMILKQVEGGMKFLVLTHDEQFADSISDTRLCLAKNGCLHAKWGQSPEVTVPILTAGK